MTIKKQVLINLGEGDFKKGFTQTTIRVQQIGGNRQGNFIELDYDFPPALPIQDVYQTWQANYDAIIKFSRTRTGFKKDQVTNIGSVEECNQNIDALRESLNHWLNPVKEKLEQALELNPEDEINVVIQTQNISSESTKNYLQKIPWHWWNFFRQDNFTDVALSFSDSEEGSSISSEEASAFPRPKRVKILCVLGDSRDIDVEADRRLLRKIPGAYCVFLRQPTRLKFFYFMEKERWDILFFSGHSKTDEDENTGLLYLNPEETLDIQEIRETIKTAIKRYKGMKLAIFNSCDGLGLARKLAEPDLGIAQIIVWREPVPDEVAQEFLKSFLNYFTGLKGSIPFWLIYFCRWTVDSGIYSLMRYALSEMGCSRLSVKSFPMGLSLYRSVQQARLEVEKYINKNHRLPKVSWLPVIHQNLAKESITWKQLRGLPDIEPLISRLGLRKTDITRKTESPRESLLNRVEESWIEGVLEKSLHIKETLELGLIEYFDAVIATARGQEENYYIAIFALYLLIQSHLHQLALLLIPNLLPEGTRAIDIFGELKNKRTMLILGEPGSGKTTGLLEIAHESIIDARQDTTLPIPVVLNLSSWAGERQTKPLADWLIQEINRIYLFSQKQCETWIKNEQLLLLLDGLDEVRESQREACIRAINQFLREYGKTEMVVCCRIQDYTNLSEKLHFQSAVFYKSPTEEQIDRYLDDAQEELSAVKELKKEDEAIQKLVKTPLTLNLIVVAYQDKSREKLLEISSFSERRSHLLETYIKRRFEEEQASNSEPSSRDTNHLKNSKEQSLYWLKWLAQKMTQKSQQELLIEQIQPDWLPVGIQQGIYDVSFRLMIGLIAGLIGVLHFGTQVTNDLEVQTSLVVPSIIAGLASGLSSLLLSEFIPKFIPRNSYENIARFIPRFIPKISYKNISRFIPGTLSGLLYVIITFSMVYSIVAENLEQIDKWRVILSPLMIDGVVLGLFFSLLDRKIGIIDTIDQSWKKARKYSKFGLIGGSIYVLWRLLFTSSYDFGNSDYLFYIFRELLIFTILPGLIGFLDKGDNLEQTIIPNQGVWRSAKTAVFFFIIFFPVGMVCGLGYSDGGIHEVISIGLAVGLLAGLAGGRGPVFAGLVLIQHFVLRVILWSQGYIPWNYARFLDYATERIFLRKVGGGYIFIHRMLQEHFAQMPLERENIQRS